MNTKRFSPARLDAFTRAKILGMRVGDASHRFIGIWVVTAGGRVYVRSWDVSKDGWNARLRKERAATVQVGTKTIRVAASRVSRESTLAAVDRAYFEKYPTKASRKYCLGLSRGRRRASTLELRPR